MERQDILDQAKVGGWAVVRQKICSVNPKNDSLILGLENYDGEKLVFYTQVLSIEPPPETDAKKIARLEAELAKAPRRIEWSGGGCPTDKAVVVWQRNGKTFQAMGYAFDWRHSSQDDDIIAYMVLPS